jgi:hypothetical protein
MLPRATLRDFEELPIDAQQQIIDFIAFIKERYKNRKSSHLQTKTESSFGSIKVKKRVSLEQMDAAIRQKGARLDSN